MLGLALTSFFTALVTAAPSINLPINAQVPPVAVANQAYNFVFSASTFTSTAGPINYTLSNNPSWLQLSGSSRTFYGTPGIDGVGSGGVGSFVANVIATDETGSTAMPVTFVISTNAGPGLGTPVAAQLPAFGAFSSPDTLLLTPGTPLSLTFSPSTFTNVDVHTTYYAMCANNTPLPSWINFDSSSLSFSGNAPQATSPSELPQSFRIQLTASEVVGFAQAITSFELVIENHMFTFGNSLQIINTTFGTLVNYTALQSDLSLDGQPALGTDLAQAATDAPPWLLLDNGTLILSGITPRNAVQQNFTVNVTDVYGDSASTKVIIQITGDTSKNLFSPITTLNATIGANFTFALNTSLYSTQDVHVIVDPGTASAWLQFNPDSLDLYGYVPSNLRSQVVQANVTAIQRDQSQSQIVDIDLRCENAPCPATSNQSGIPGATAKPGSNSRARGKTSKDWIAAAVIVPIVMLVGLLLLCCCRGWSKKLIIIPKRRKKNMTSPPTRNEEEDSMQRITPFWNRNKDRERLSSEASELPRLSLVQNPKPSRISRFRFSKKFNDGANQAFRPDSWQNYLMQLESSQREHPADVLGKSHNQRAQNLRVEASAVQGKRASTSTTSASISSMVLSKSKKRDRKSRSSGLGLFSSQTNSGFGHGRNAISQGSGSVYYINKGIGHGGGSTSQGPSGWGIVRNSWRNLSRLSWTSTQSSPNSNDPVVEEGSDRPQTQRSFASMISSFPRPSTSNTADILKRPQVIHEVLDDELTDTVAGKSLSRTASKARPVSPFGRKDSTKNGGLQDFHKRRVKQRFHNPLFSAHLSGSNKALLTAGRSLTGHRKTDENLFHPVTPPNQMIPCSYSQTPLHESSSLKPNPKRSNRSFSIDHGKRSRINYHFTTRAISPLRRSRSSYASTSSSSRFADPVGVAPFYPEGAFVEDTDEDGNKLWRHTDHPTPLNINRAGIRHVTDASDTELIDSLLSAGQHSAAQRLSYLKEQTEGSDEDGYGDEAAIELRSAKGRKIDRHSVLDSGDSGNQSVKGDIGDAGGSTAFM